jgi:hypothetical protein
LLSYSFSMRGLIRICAIAPSAFALASCTPPAIDIAAKRVNGRQVITLTQDWGVIFSDKKVPCVDRVDVSESGPKGKVIWRFDAKTSACVDLASFTVGEVPAGFVESIHLPPSSRGRFDMLVIGVGIGEAEIVLP